MSTSVYLPSESLLVLGLSSGAIALMSALHALADTLFPSTPASTSTYSPSPSSPLPPLHSGDRCSPSPLQAQAQAAAATEVGVGPAAGAAPAVAIGKLMRRSASASELLPDEEQERLDATHSAASASGGLALPPHIVLLEGHRGPVTALCYPYLHNPRYEQAHLLSGVLFLRRRSIISCLWSYCYYLLVTKY